MVGENSQVYLFGFFFVILIGYAPNPLAADMLSASYAAPLCLFPKTYPSRLGIDTAPHS